MMDYCHHAPAYHLQQCYYSPDRFDGNYIRPFCVKIITNCYFFAINPKIAFLTQSLTLYRKAFQAAYLCEKSV